MVQSSRLQNNAGFPCIQLLCCCFGVDLTNLKLLKDVWFMDTKTQEAMRDVSHYTANHFTIGRPKWFVFLKIYTTEMVEHRQYGQ